MLFHFGLVPNSQLPVVFAWKQKPWKSLFDRYTVCRAFEDWFSVTVAHSLQVHTRYIFCSSCTKDWKEEPVIFHINNYQTIIVSREKYTPNQAFGTVGGAHWNGNIKQGQPPSYLVRGFLLAFNCIQQASYVCEPVFHFAPADLNWPWIQGPIMLSEIELTYWVPQQ